MKTKFGIVGCGFLSGSGGAGGSGVLLGIPSIMLQFCSVESSAFFK